MKYFWKENVMNEEPILFVRKPGELPAGHLLVPAAEIIKVSNLKICKLFASLVEKILEVLKVLKKRLY